MHSSRMHTAHSSSHGGGLVLIPLNFPLGCWPGPDPPEFPIFNLVFIIMYIFVHYIDLGYEQSCI